MKRQIGFAEAESKGAKCVTKRQRFLAEMDKLVPWPRLLSAIEPYYPKGKRGRPPIGLECMLRIYFLQRKQWDGRPHPITASMCQSGSVIDRSNQKGRHHADYEQEFGLAATRAAPVEVRKFC